MGDWSDNLEYEHREYYGHFYDTDEDVHEEEEESKESPIIEKINKESLVSAYMETGITQGIV
jgi:hypothetical protein